MLIMHQMDLKSVNFDIESIKMMNRQNIKREPSIPIGRSIRLCVTLSAALLLLGACRSVDPDEGPTAIQSGEEVTIETIEDIESVSTSPDTATDEPVFYGFTYQNPEGNRLVNGVGKFPTIDPVGVQLSGTPQWLVGAPFREGSLWVVTFSDGGLEAFYQEGQKVQPVRLAVEALPIGMPPLLKVQGDSAQLIKVEDPAASPLTHPVVLDESGEVAYLSNQGDLVIWDGEESSRFTVNSLPDARILSDGEGRLLFLAGATDRYAHAVVGDHLEASEILLYELAPLPDELLKIAIPSPKVIEGIMPLWVDLDGDGAREIIVTTSDTDVGARFEVYNQAGLLVATSEAIGLGFRWRHQIAVAPFGPDGELELATVRTPHIGGVVEFFSLSGSQLIKEAELRGYTSHVIGSRNLDMAVTGDFDGDGRIELLLPDQSLNSLGAIRRTENGAEVAWNLTLDGKLSTNLAVVTLPDGSLALGAATQNEHLWLWIP
jgi:hypothetical protein